MIKADSDASSLSLVDPHLMRDQILNRPHPVPPFIRVWYQHYQYTGLCLLHVEGESAAGP